MVAQVAAGVARALAVSSDQRNPALPEVPTVQQAGVPGYNVMSWNALAAPPGTPPEFIEKIGRAAREAVIAPAVQDKLGMLGMRLEGSTPAKLQALLASEIKALIGWYIGSSGVASGFGAASAIVALLVWVYGSAQVFLYGAEVTWLFALRFGSRREPVAQRRD